LLTADEARVLGCLMEKAVTTPDHYPLSVNALISACNQSTNREPVVEYDESTVERILELLREKDLCRRVRATGARVVKHRHVLDETMPLSVPQFAVLGVLLLRGPQTPGELKQRTERWHSFRSLDDIESTLQQLTERDLVRQLPRRPGQKEARWQQLLATEDTSAPVPEPSIVEPVVEVAVAPEVREDRSLEIRNPATAELVRSVAVTEAGEIAQKVGRARAAQRAWSVRGFDDRARVLSAFRDLLAAEADDCAAITTSEMGKPITQARNEVRAVLDRIDWFLAHVGAVIEPRVVTDGGEVGERITHEPVGVVVHISAWNYPYFVALNSIVPALLAGNAVLYKPSEYATLTGLRLVDLMHRAGVPVDIMQTVIGGGATGATLVAADIDMVCFTGSYGTGLKVASAAADRLLRVQLELGGKDAAYVCDDVDVEDAAIAVAEGAFYNAGQSCSAIERVFVHDAVSDRFVDALVELVSGYRVGDPSDDATELGPVARAAQLDVLDEQIADAIANGGRVLCGGKRVEREGNWYEPTVVLEAGARSALMRDESFGPVIGVARVASDDEARTLMNDTEFGLGASVFTRDRARAEQILSGLDVGNAYWNTSDRSSVRLPWAGRRHSGTGVSMSESGVRQFVKEKAWHLHS
jgi:acyl-CoA reductase-like NAD-dependent aldehyde dehydrogenase